MNDTPKNSARKGGAPNGNTNARNSIRHGLRAGSLPKDAKHVEIQCNRLRRELEDACLASRGGVTLTDAARITTALRWERHGALCLRWLRLKGDELKPADYIKFSESIAKASTCRDKAIAALELDTDQEVPWQGLTLEVTDDD